MKYTLLIVIIFASVIIYAGTDLFSGIVGLTQLNGEGCQCHNLNVEPTVNVWIEGPDTLERNQTAQYFIKMTGGPAVTGGFNVAARFSNLFVADTGTLKIDGELAHSWPRFFVNDTVAWKFNFTASNSATLDTIYSVAQSVNNDGIPTSLDKWNFGAKFPVRIIPPVPVELSSFNAMLNKNSVLISWTTATETNNHGFEIEKKYDRSNNNNGITSQTIGEWNKIGFIAGHGTTTDQNKYSFEDLNFASGKYSYRLKQIDLNGDFKYSEVIDIYVPPSDFTLLQNYPNPFNPSTVIEWQLATDSNVRLMIYSPIGEEVDMLIDGYQEAGNHSTVFNVNSALTSGVYLYSLEIVPADGTPSHNYAKKMILLR